MLLKIEDYKYVSDLQEKFNECFPYLHLGFFRTKHKRQEVSEANSPIQPNTLVGSIIKKQKSRLLEIKSWYKTGEVEQIFKENFGLNVRIFRLQDEHWVPTSNTDELTLQQQNDLAQSSIHKNKPSAPYDGGLDI